MRPGGYFRVRRRRPDNFWKEVMIYLNAFCAVLCAMLLAWWFTSPARTPYRRFMMLWLAFCVVLNVVAVAMAL